MKCLLRIYKEQDIPMFTSRGAQLTQIEFNLDSKHTNIDKFMIAEITTMDDLSALVNVYGDCHFYINGNNFIGYYGGPKSIDGIDLNEPFCGLDFGSCDG